MTFILASLIGAYALLILYYFFINRFIVIWKGFLFATFTGVVSAILPAKAFHGDFSSNATQVDMVIFMSIFVMWQTLFGLTIVLSEQAVATASFPEPG